MNAVPLHRSDWTLRAACVGLPPVLFSSEEPVAGGEFAARQAAVAAAKAVCFGCPVWRDCLNYALDNKVEDGIWGGLTATERLGPRGATPVTVAGHTGAAGSRTSKRH